jgi:hypothetical protein
MGLGSVAHPGGYNINPESLPVLFSKTKLMALKRANFLTDRMGRMGLEVTEGSEWINPSLTPNSKRYDQISKSGPVFDAEVDFSAVGR